MEYETKNKEKAVVYILKNFLFALYKKGGNADD